MNLESKNFNLPEKMSEQTVILFNQSNLGIKEATRIVRLEYMMQGIKANIFLANNKNDLNSIINSKIEKVLLIDKNSLENIINYNQDKINIIFCEQ